VCADVGPRGQEIELVRVPTRQGPVRLWRGEPRVRERRRWDEGGTRLADDERACMRHHFDDPGVGPSHAPPEGVRGDFDDIRRLLEVVPQGVFEGMWLCIHDEGVLEQCVGLSMEWHTMVRRAVVVGAAMTG
jgi:hypothetical protein